MKLGEMNGYEFHLPTSGGKAGTGFQKTSTIQIRKGGIIIKQIRFVIGDPAKRREAVAKAKDFVNAQVSA